MCCMGGRVCVCLCCRGGGGGGVCGSYRDCGGVRVRCVCAVQCWLSAARGGGGGRGVHYYGGVAVGIITSYRLKECS